MFSPKRVGDAGATVIIYVKIRAMINNMGIRSDLYANNFNDFQCDSRSLPKTINFDPSCVKFECRRLLDVPTNVYPVNPFFNNPDGLIWRLAFFL